MRRSGRLKAISEIVSSSRILRQDELLERLSSAGYKVTQASISRDLDALGISKVGGQYSLPVRPLGDPGNGNLTFVPAGDNLIVVRCPPGMASAAAVKIDSLTLPEITGTIAGDDTIFIAVKNADDQRAAIRKIMEVY